MSHFCVATFVREPSENYVHPIMYPFGVESDEFFERIILMTKDDYIRAYKVRYPETALSDNAIWAQAGTEYNDVDYEAGLIYESYNPDGQWDWYVIGGRWSNQICAPKRTMPQHMIVPGAPRGKSRWGMAAQLKDIEWHKIRERWGNRYSGLKKYWEDAEKEDEYTIKALRHNWGSKEAYLREGQDWLPYSFIHPLTGEWFSQDTMTQQEFRDSFLQIINDPGLQEYWLIIVDCHI